MCITLLPFRAPSDKFLLLARYPTQPSEDNMQA